MARVGIIVCCNQCGKPQSKTKLLRVQELWGTRSLCRNCYQRHQRALWGYW